MNYKECHLNNCRQDSTNTLKSHIRIRFLKLLSDGSLVNLKSRLNVHFLLNEHDDPHIDIGYSTLFT